MTLRLYETSLYNLRRNHFKGLKFPVDLMMGNFCPSISSRESIPYNVSPVFVSKKGITSFAFSTSMKVRISISALEKGILFSGFSNLYFTNKPEYQVQSGQ